MAEIIIPSSPVDLQKIKAMIHEATDCMARIDAENETKKEIIDEIEEQFDISKKIINRMVRTAHKMNFNEQASESDDFQLLYETLYGAPADDDSAD